MKVDLDIMAVAVQLVGEFGDGAVRMARARLVEFVADDNRRAAAFWRQVAETAETLLTHPAPERPGAPPGALSTWTDGGMAGGRTA